MDTTRAVAPFLLAGVAEIGGGYLVWRWLREGAPWPIGLAGAAILAVYGVVPTPAMTRGVPGDSAREVGRTPIHLLRQMMPWRVGVSLPELPSPTDDGLFRP
jgi:hypothetical protein